MEYQPPARGITLNRDFGDAKFYTVDCDCGNPDDDIKLEVEAKDTGITVHVWTTVKSDWYSNTWTKRYDIENKFLQDLHWNIVDLFNGIWNRVKLTWRVWTRGYLEYESWTVMSQQQALNFAETLKLAIDDVKTFRETNKK